MPAMVERQVNNRAAGRSSAPLVLVAALSCSWIACSSGASSTGP